jgi:hypothetical protein
MILVILVIVAIGILACFAGTILGVGAIFFGGRKKR